MDERLQRLERLAAAVLELERKGVVDVGWRWIDSGFAHRGEADPPGLDGAIGEFFAALQPFLNDEVA